MSNPDGFMIEDRMYPANSIGTEMAMSERIRELEAELIDELEGQSRSQRRIAELEEENAKLKEALRIIETGNCDYPEQVARAALIQEDK